MNISQAGIDAIKSREGFSAVPYTDAGGKSIGYGHYITPGQSFTSITTDQAEELLATDLRIAENTVSAYVTVPLTQNQYDALVSFVYNEGAGAFRTSTLLNKLNAGDYAGAVAEFKKWTRSQGAVLQALVDRRAGEIAQFNA